MTRMSGPDCAVMCNLINTHTHTHTYRPPILSTSPLHTISRCGEIEAHINWSMHGDAKGSSTRYWNYLEVYWSCAGGLSAVNAMGMQLHDPINS